MDLSRYFISSPDASLLLPASYNYFLVLLSYLVAVLGSYTFLQFADRITELGKSAGRYGWLACGAVAMGAGTWAMHFIGMIAYVLPIPTTFTTSTTLLSVVPAVLAAGIALHVVARPVVTLRRLLVGGTCMGVGIAAMHYIGMGALQLNALVRYDPVLFAISVIVAIGLAILALQVRSLVSKTRLQRSKEVLGALILGFAVAAMHYVAMASTYCFASTGEEGSRSGFSPVLFAGVIAFIISLILAIAIVAVILDRRAARETALLERALESNKQTSEQLFQAQKMEAVGQLTGGVAHDFNNILMVIMANVDALEEEINIAPQLLAKVKEIGKASERAAALTRQLLAFSRKQPLRPESTNINELVATTVKLLGSTLGERIKIRTDLAADIWNVGIDRAQLESALINLSINARDAMPDGGQLIIQTNNTPLDEAYVALHPDVGAGDYVMLSVTDTGSGMSPEVRSKVFEPFFSTKDVGKGSGLGLSMVYGFIKQSSGQIEIKSDVGRGTTIKLYIPRSHAERDSAVPPQRSSTQGNRERILVVEDDPQVRAGVVQMLRILNYTVTEASDGAAGLAAFKSAKAPYDLLLTDVVMPGAMNGKALADEVVRQRPRTRVVFMSGYSEKAIVHHDRLDAGVLLLSKPFRKDDVAQILRQALA
jgi:NO-binding membrane sensor protein with MHYT domain/nitrogen-specific signal transduction histidine kinase/ActR/RegA family two-component response regulator